MVSPHMSPSTSYEHSNAGCNSVQGSRPYNEDTFISDSTFLPVGQAERSRNPSSFQLHAVFDGHGGAGVSQFCAKNIPDIIRGGIRNELRANTAVISSLEASPSTSSSDLAVDAVKGVLAQAVVETHSQLDPYKHEWVGSTAVISLIYKHHVWVANTGDSRAVRCVAGKPVEVTRDHKASCPLEAVRVEQSGGHILYNSGPRLMGVLAVTRAIGDMALQGRGLTAEPETFHFNRSTDDEFLILASDGLWDVLSNQEAVDLVQRVFQKVGTTSSPSDSSVACRVAANVLTRVALVKNSKDNITAVVVDLRPNQTFQPQAPFNLTPQGHAPSPTPPRQSIPFSKMSPTLVAAEKPCLPLVASPGNTGRLRPRESASEVDEPPCSPPKRAKPLSTQLQFVPRYIQAISTMVC